MGISCRIGKCNKFLDLGLKIKIKKNCQAKTCALFNIECVMVMANVG
jgi:hypothetical protein